MLPNAALNASWTASDSSGSRHPTAASAVDVRPDEVHLGMRISRAQSLQRVDILRAAALGLTFRFGT